MVSINALDVVERCYSNEDGQVIQNLIKVEFKKGNKVAVSFAGISAVNSSFVNTAFIDLLTEYDFSFIKNHLTFVNSTSQINNMIKSRFDFEVNERKNLITV
ncbi:MULTISPECIES: STAS-like domain-containing protein [Bacillus cereus group]|uniref:STAS-like domain-containing protein n=1 Tax=Bacillus cereus group TaxID=86661 RepID=UPI0011EE233F|nr:MULTISPECIES: STAS-like domain-containing protein [Bacillus cereus group]KAA0796351.1 DUF4325 domain-containing protein [Bacillus sp. BB56-3]